MTRTDCNNIKGFSEVRRYTAPRRLPIRIRMLVSVSHPWLRD